MSILVEGQLSTVIVSDQTGTINTSLVQHTVVTVPRALDLVTAGIAGPRGPQGLNEEEILMDMLTETNNIEDSPSPGELTVYLGWATQTDALTSEAVWKIKRRIIAVDGDKTEKFADGNALYDNVWDDHLILTY